MMAKRKAAAVTKEAIERVFFSLLSCSYYYVLCNETDRPRQLLWFIC